MKVQFVAVLLIIAIGGYSQNDVKKQKAHIQLVDINPKEHLSKDQGFGKPTTYLEQRENDQRKNDYTIYYIVGGFIITAGTGFIIGRKTAKTKKE